MTEHDEHERPQVRIVDKRRYRDEDSADPEGAAAPSGSPADVPEQLPASDEVDLVRAQAAEYRDHLQRLQAEFDNYRKRVMKEQTRAVEMAAQPVVLRLLEVLDEFDLALLAAERTPDFEQFRKGVELVYAKLADTLHAEGLERIEADGKPFDPVEHEALMQTGEGDGEPHVGEVFRQGYRLKGRVLRPASVRVDRT
ncbi:MAG TPA: nucleotide exchange factor GrpE [Actinomycetota bacterium]